MAIHLLALQLRVTIIVGSRNIFEVRQTMPRPDPDHKAQGAEVPDLNIEPFVCQR